MIIPDRIGAKMGENTTPSHVILLVLACATRFQTLDLSLVMGCLECISPSDVSFSHTITWTSALIRPTNTVKELLNLTGLYTEAQRQDVVFDCRCFVNDGLGLCSNKTDKLWMLCEDHRAPWNGINMRTTWNSDLVSVSGEPLPVILRPIDVNDRADRL